MHLLEQFDPFRLSKQTFKWIFTAISYPGLLSFTRKWVLHEKIVGIISVALFLLDFFFFLLPPLEKGSPLQTAMPMSVVFSGFASEWLLSGGIGIHVPLDSFSMATVIEKSPNKKKKIDAILCHPFTKLRLISLTVSAAISIISDNIGRS